MELQTFDPSLDLGSSEVRAGDVLAYQIVNRGTATIMCGYAYRLERRDEGGWTIINREMRFRAVGLLVDSGKTRDLEAQVPAGASAGQYRISTVVRQVPPSPTEPLNVTALFQVR